jgi:hypothetical protein
MRLCPQADCPQTRRVSKSPRKGSPKQKGKEPNILLPPYSSPKIIFQVKKARLNKLSVMKKPNSLYYITRPYKTDGTLTNPISVVKRLAKFYLLLKYFLVSLTFAAKETLWALLAPWRTKGAKWANRLRINGSLSSAT